MSQTTPTVPPIANKIMKFMLTSSLHGIVDKSILLISFTGRKTGKAYSTPVSYSQSGDQVTIFTHANWWKNLQPGKPVTLRIRGKDIQGLPEPVAEDKQAIAAGLVEHLKKVPSDASYYQVTFDGNKNPKLEDVEKAVQNVVMVRFRLC
jgi:deazaflavin-dependent oxidoreductase (nitroreductase family)